MLAASLTIVAACSSDETELDDDGTDTTSSTGGSGGAAGSGGMQPFALSSSAFAEGETIGMQYECGPPAPVSGTGDNLTPPLSWTPGPAETQSYAVVVRDVDAMIAQFPEGIIHWVIYDIPANVSSLPEGIPAGYEVSDPAGAKQAEVQGSGFFGYFGPCSPNSINTYVFTIHAMATPTLPGVTMASSESEIAGLIESTSIASASLSGES